VASIAKWLLGDRRDKLSTYIVQGAVFCTGDSYPWYIGSVRVPRRTLRASRAGGAPLVAGASIESRRADGATTCTTDWIDDHAQDKPSRSKSSPARSAEFADTLEKFFQVITDHVSDPKALEVFKARHLEEKTEVELAEHYGITKQAISLLLKKCHKAIRNHCAEEFFA
jgi:hypothetical protein